MKKFNEAIIKVLEDAGFNIGEITEQDGEYYIELSQYTPEGEDWYVIIWFDGTDEDFIKSVRTCSDNFDVDEEAEPYIEMRGQRGVPNSIADLIEDAKWKGKTLEDLADALEAIDSEDECCSDTDDDEEEEEEGVPALYFILHLRGNLRVVFTMGENHFFKIELEGGIGDAIGTDKEGNQIQLMDVIVSEEVDVIEQMERNQKSEKLTKIISEVLSGRELFIIINRYGLFHKEPMTQREISSLLKISRSYVSRIEKKALEKLKAGFMDQTYNSEN